MATLSVTNLIPGDPRSVYEFVTGFPTNGDVNLARLESKYGKFLERNGNRLVFREEIGGGTRWEYTFQPPSQRYMRALDSTWSDRDDRFEAVEGGTQWTMTWLLKSRGLPVITQWLTFHISSKKQIHSQIVRPVLDHFRQPH